MTLPDDDLRSAFQHWRTQESRAVPEFRGQGSVRSRRPQAAWSLSFPPALAWGAALAMLLIAFVWVIPPRQITLAEALPRPLLAPPETPRTFLAGFPEPEGAFTDFLQPQGKYPSLF